ncbi:MAG: substrate-binding domain-containing protein [Selenomonadaceae bacterium]|nr:substrate-binding domain-containing protein [Selenomonadaceae bacterium]
MFHWKKCISFLLCIVFCIGLCGCAVNSEKKVFKVGITVYNINDPYMKLFINRLETALKDKFADDNLILRYEVADAEGDRNTQLKQVEYLMQQKCDVLLLNLVNVSSAAEVLNITASKHIPVVLFNRKPDNNDLNIGPAICYVGTDAFVEGQMQGDMVKSLWEKKKKEIDKNNNGKLDYILLEGEPDYFASQERTDGFRERIVSHDLPMNILANFTADWEKDKAYRTMDKLPEDIIKNVELIVGNNDDMVLGAYEFYRAKNLPVPCMVGVNDNDVMHSLVDSGEAWGTVNINQEEQIEHIINIVYNLQQGGNIDKKVINATPYTYMK